MDSVTESALEFQADAQYNHIIRLLMKRNAAEMNAGRKTAPFPPALLVSVVLLLTVAEGGWLVAGLGITEHIKAWELVCALAIGAVAAGYLFFEVPRIARPPSGASAQSGEKPAASGPNAPVSAVPQFVDDLTKLPTRYWFDQTFNSEIARSRRYGHPLSIAILDVDRFSGVNRVRGRAAGDYVLGAIAQILRSSVRQTDHLARLADDEFALILTESDNIGARHVAEKIRRAIELYPFDEGLEITVSVGFATFAKSDSTESFFGRCHAAVDSAVQKGGNAIVAAAS